MLCGPPACLLRGEGCTWHLGGSRDEDQSVERKGTSGHRWPWLRPAKGAGAWQEANSCRAQSLPTGG